jgi:hypothetical protein
MVGELHKGCMVGDGWFGFAWLFELGRFCGCLYDTHC